MYRRTFPSVWYSSFSLRSCEHYITIKQHSMQCVKFPKPARRNVSPARDVTLADCWVLWNRCYPPLCIFKVKWCNRTKWYISVERSSWVNEKTFVLSTRLSYKQIMAIQMSSELYVPGSTYWCVSKSKPVIVALAKAWYGSALLQSCPTCLVCVQYLGLHNYTNLFTRTMHPQ